MSDIASQLTEYTHHFLAHADTIVPASTRSANADVLRLLIGWSLEHEEHLEARGPDGRDPLAGVAERGSGILVWRVYPRRLDGAKVALLPGVQDRMASADRAAIASVLEQLQPGRRIERGQKLEIGLHHLAANSQWLLFESALERALDAITRLTSDVPVA